MSHEDMGDQLGALARASQGHDEPQPAQRPSNPGQQTGHPVTHEEDQGDFVAAEVDDESGGEIAEVPLHFQAAATQSGPAYRPLPRKGKKKNNELKAMAAPILMTVGVMLLMPAFWAVLVLTGAPVPMSDREDASTMAKVMLLCWPLALTLVIPAVFMFVQLGADKKRK